ncbi:MAG: hypothetical protein ACFFGZ_13705 [Candidatus Thorarchaeota archaeon]
MTAEQRTDREARRDQAYMCIIDLVREAGEIDDLTLMEQCKTQFPDSGWWATTYSGFAAHLRWRGLLEGREVGGRSFLKLRLRSPEKVRELLPQAKAFLLQLCGTVDAPGLSERDVLAQTGETLQQSGEKAEVIEDATNWALFSLIIVQKKLQRAYFFKGEATGCRIFARPAEQEQTKQQLDWTIPLDAELK